MAYQPLAPEPPAGVHGGFVFPHGTTVEVAAALAWVRRNSSGWAHMGALGHLAVLPLVKVRDSFVDSEYYIAKGEFLECCLQKLGTQHPYMVETPEELGRCEAHFRSIEHMACLFQVERGEIEALLDPRRTPCLLGYDEWVDAWVSQRVSS